MKDWFTIDGRYMIVIFEALLKIGKDSLIF